ncbi:hypothetical protein GDO78_018524 [Eleutherodactylus coqui]|uniref:Uncharacterized protein n=1 Tax=Eleutherodactylus coqui TaxID=57060 RepID=A0A8J6EJG7_ELECQ|nr:hypothetical protein GDO78_018524 [Eleutherodactylus coqui]
MAVSFLRFHLGSFLSPPTEGLTASLHTPLSCPSSNPVYHKNLHYWKMSWNYHLFSPLRGPVTVQHKLTDLQRCLNNLNSLVS